MLKKDLKLQHGGKKGTVADNVDNVNVFAQISANKTPLCSPQTLKLFWRPHCMIRAPDRSVFKAPLMNLRQLENKVFKNSTGFKNVAEIFLKCFHK